MTTLTANDLRTRGVSAIERILKNSQEVIISVRGRPHYVVVDIAHYEHLRECETMAAWAQARGDPAAGRYRAESADTHTARIHGELAGAP